MRARAIDGLPVFGEFDQLRTLFVASGFNRVGLTLAPCLENFIAKWFDGDKANEGSTDLDLSSWRPDRPMHDYNCDGNSVRDFVATRLANAFEHRLYTDETSKQVKKRSLSSLHQMRIHSFNTWYKFRFWFSPRHVCANAKPTLKK